MAASNLTQPNSSSVRGSGGSSIEVSYSTASNPSNGGIISQTLPSIGQSSSGNQIFKGIAGQSLPSPSQQSSGALKNPPSDLIQKSATTVKAGAPILSLEVGYSSAFPISSGTNASISQSLPSLSQSISGSLGASGSIEQSLPSLSQSIDGSLGVSGSIEQSLPSISQTGLGGIKSPPANLFQDSATTVRATPSSNPIEIGYSTSASEAAITAISADVSQSLPSLSQGLQAVENFEVEVSQSLPSPSQSSTVELKVVAASTQSLPSVSQSSSVTHTAAGVTASGSSTLPSLSQQVLAEEEFKGTLNQSLPSVSSYSVLSMFPSGTIAQTLPGLSQSVDAALYPSGTISQTLPTLSQSSILSTAPKVLPNTTTMRLLLMDLKNLLQNNIGAGGILSGIKAVKRGILPERNQYPLITILPLQERIVRRYSGQRVVVARDVQVFLYSKAVRGKEDIYNIQSMADDTLDLLRDNSKVPDRETDRDTTLWAEFSTIDVDSDSGMEASFQVTYYSHEDLPQRSFTGTQTDDVSPVIFIEQIYNLLNDGKPLTLSKVREVFREDWGTVKRLLLPSITVVMDGQNQHKYLSGQDRLSTTAEVKILSSVASASDSTIDTHLEILEPVKDLLQSQGDWTGRAINTQIEGIRFGQRVGSNDLQYETIITVRTDAQYLVP